MITHIVKSTAQREFIAAVRYVLSEHRKIAVNDGVSVILIDDIPHVEHVVTDTQSIMYGMREVISLQEAVTRGLARFA